MCAVTCWERKFGNRVRFIHIPNHFWFLLLFFTSAHCQYVTRIYLVTHDDSTDMRCLLVLWGSKGYYNQASLQLELSSLNPQFHHVHRTNHSQCWGSFNQSVLSHNVLLYYFHLKDLLANMRGVWWWWWSFQTHIITCVYSFCLFTRLLRSPLLRQIRNRIKYPQPIGWHPPLGLRRTRQQLWPFGSCDFHVCWENELKKWEWETMHVREMLSFPGSIWVSGFGRS